MGFEKFTKQRRPAKDQAMVSVLKWGQLGINRVCNEKYFKNCKYAVLYYDTQEEKIGIQPTNEATNDAHNVRQLKAGKLASVSAIAFLKHYGIDHMQSKAYMAKWNDKEKLLEITLK